MFGSVLFALSIRYGSWILLSYPLLLMLGALISNNLMTPFVLLSQAYGRGLMIAVIPFTAMVSHLFRSCDDTCYPCTWHVLIVSLFNLCADFGTLPVKYCISTSKPLDHGEPELACWDIQSSES